MAEKEPVSGSPVPFRDRTISTIDSSTVYTPKYLFQGYEERCVFSLSVLFFRVLFGDLWIYTREEEELSGWERDRSCPC